MERDDRVWGGRHTSHSGASRGSQSGGRNKKRYAEDPRLAIDVKVHHPQPTLPGHAQRTHIRIFIFFDGGRPYHVFEFPGNFLAPNDIVEAVEKVVRGEDITEASFYISEYSFTLFKPH